MRRYHQAGAALLTGGDVGWGVRVVQVKVCRLGHLQVHHVGGIFQRRDCVLVHDVLQADVIYLQGRETGSAVTPPHKLVLSYTCMCFCNSTGSPGTSVAVNAPVTHGTPGQYRLVLANVAATA